MAHARWPRLATSRCTPSRSSGWPDTFLCLSRATTFAPTGRASAPVPEIGGGPHIRLLQQSARRSQASGGTWSAISSAPCQSPRSLLKTSALDGRGGSGTHATSGLFERLEYRPTNGCALVGQTSQARPAGLLWRGPTSFQIFSVQRLNTTLEALGWVRPGADARRR